VLIGRSGSGEVTEILKACPREEDLSAERGGDLQIQFPAASKEITQRHVVDLEYRVFSSAASLLWWLKSSDTSYSTEYRVLWVAFAREKVNILVPIWHGVELNLNGLRQILGNDTAWSAEIAHEHLL
jgi:hypothetical protein